MMVVVVAGLAYLLGSVPFAVLMSRAFGLADPRSYGSKNPGATNVLRSGHRLAAALTLLLDGAKGTVAVLLARTLLHAPNDASGVAVAALAVFLGHLFPVFLGFRGGKGVATALGVLFGLAWWLGASVALIWLAVALLCRYASVASMVGALAAPVLYAFFAGPRANTLALALIALGIIARHRGNIRKLLAGQESRIGQKAKVPDTAESRTTPP